MYPCVFVWKTFSDRKTSQEKLDQFCFIADIKGQIISECPYEIIVYPKIATKKFLRFLPWPPRRGQIKNFNKPIMLNNP